MTQEQINSQPILENKQSDAEKAAIDASANYHLKYIHDKLAIGTTNAVANILSKSDRKTNWTLADVKDVWDKVYNGNDVNMLSVDNKADDV